MNKYIISIVITVFIFVGSFSVVNRVSATDTSIQYFINILITIGVISPDKVPAANAYIASLDASNQITPPCCKTTSTTTTASTTTIKPSLVITSPNGGEKLTIGKSVDVKWNSTGLSGEDYVYLTLFDSAIACTPGVMGCWTNFAISNFPLKNTGSFTWDTDTVYGDAGPNSPIKLSQGFLHSTSTVYKIRICRNDVCDMSDNYFSIN